MAIIVNSNITSLNAQRNLVGTQNALNTALQRLSSGLRINSAKDDAAGLFTSELLTTQIRGTNQAIRNAADGISVAQVAEGALGQIANNIQRIREIAVQAANGSLSNEAREGLQLEVDQLSFEIGRIVTTTQFNGVFLLQTAENENEDELTFQVGANKDDSVTVTLKDLSTGDFSLNTFAEEDGTVGISVSEQDDASAALDDLDADLAIVNDLRATFGAVQNRFEAIISSLQNYAENLTAARSRIVDADFAQETAALTRAQILQQAGVSILAQANAQPQIALSLLA